MSSSVQPRDAGVAQSLPCDRRDSIGDNEHRRHAGSLLAFGDEGGIALADDAHLLHDQVCSTDTDPTDS
ncbi:MAG TPA: hypothetical protein VID75_04795 [Acidimicrobiales bacterium]